jgi:hypothetical protein
VRPRRPAAAVALALWSAGCGGADTRPGPRVDLIDDAIAAVEAHYGAPQEYFEISVDTERVSVIVAVDDATAAEQGALEPDGGFTVPEPVGPASGSTFVADVVTFDRDRIFDGLRAELSDPDIVDFAIQGGPGGSVVYDATVLSGSGGVLLVLLSADGEVLGVQAS